MNPKLFTLPQITLESDLAKLVVDLEPLRTRHLTGTTPPWVFFGLKNLFQTIESVISAQIEGNNTTIVDYIDAARDEEKGNNHDEKVRMILNIERGIDRIESLSKEGFTIDKAFIHDIHKLVVEGLDTGLHAEGDTRPGGYRLTPRKISQSKHVLPAPTDVPDLMASLIEFINTPVPHQLELIKIALVHHRFVWIHPYGNGNGRVVRLLTYAMLTQSGYIDKNGARLLDPAAVFGEDKRIYYDRLAAADSLSEEGLIEWSTYMLGGLLGEVQKIDRLLDGNFSKQNIVLPALAYALDKKRLTQLEHDMLVTCVQKDIVSASDFAHLFSPNVSKVNISHAIKKLRDQNLIEPEHPNARKYTLCMNRNAITSGILYNLDKHGFLPPHP